MSSDGVRTLCTFGQRPLFVKISQICDIRACIYSYIMELVVVHDLIQNFSKINIKAGKYISSQQERL